MPETILSVRDLEVRYDSVSAARGINLDVHAGEVRTILGANGAGKSSIIKGIDVMDKPVGGRIEFHGERIDKLRPDRIHGRGIAWVPEGREIFATMTVEENLLLGGWSGPKKEVREERTAEMYQLFPRLDERRAHLGHALSGGEQQMLAIARALMSRPALIVMDEPSLGLAPIMVDHIYEIVRKINSEGVAILLVEQNAVKALDVSGYAYLLQDGEFVHEAPSDELKKSDVIQRSYLGIREPEEQVPDE